MSTILPADNLLIPDWPAPVNVRAVSSKRSGGYSAGAYQSFNLGDHVGDIPTDVERNRQLFSALAAMPKAPLWLQQVHGTAVARPDLVKLQNGQPVIADAAYSHHAQDICLVMTADCLPLLVCDKAGREVAAIHAGWRGLAAGVIEQTLRHFQAAPSDIMVWLGPAIGPQAFEVGAEVRAAFIAQAQSAEQAFSALANDKYLADIYLLARQRLAAIGVTAVYGGEHCTYLQSEDFFSYRRDGQTGRMASAIWLE